MRELLSQYKYLPFALTTGSRSICDGMDALSAKHIRGSPKHRNFLRRKSNKHISVYKYGD